MDDLGNNTNNSTYNFLTENKWAIFISGHWRKKKYIDWLYVIFIFLFLAGFVTLSAGAVIVSENKAVKLLACHGCVLSLGLMWVLTIRTRYNKLYNITSYIIENGVYHYEQEESDEEIRNIIEKSMAYLRRISTYTTRALVFGGLCNFIFAPVMKFLLFDQDTSEKIINPNLPLPLYIPFDTSNEFGFCLAYLIVAIYDTFLVTILISLNEVYVTCTVQLSMQFKILNYSLNAIEKRAYRKLVKWEGELLVNSREKIEEMDQRLSFQDCLLSCLRENIKHHQSLIRFKNLIRPFIGGILLGIFMLASLGMAMAVIVVLESTEFIRTSEFLITFGTEMAYIFMICLYGENVNQESGRVFYSLYNSPWPKMDKRNTTDLAVMMCNCLHPVTLTARLVPVSASVETFSTIISTMYQIVNVMRNF